MGAIFLVSNQEVATITQEITKGLPNLMFVVSQIDIETTNGMAEKETWDFIRNAPFMVRKTQPT